MKVLRSFYPRLLLLGGWLVGGAPALAVERGTIHQDAGQKVVTLADGQGNLALRLNYDGRCVLDQVIVRGREVAAESGVASGIRMDGQWFTTQGRHCHARSCRWQEHSHCQRNCVWPAGERGPGDLAIYGSGGSDCVADQPRLSRAATLEDAAFPEWDFSSLSTWTGGMLDNGGVVWNKYLETPNATYGAHAGTVTFWNREQHDCLRIVPTLPKDQHGAVRFSHQTNNVFSFNYVVSGEELKPKHDLCRFLPDRQDLWAPFHGGSPEKSASNLPCRRWITTRPTTAARFQGWMAAAFANC